MKNLLALILVGSMLLLTGCAKEEAANDETIEEVASVAEPEVPVAVAEEFEAGAPDAVVTEQPEAEAPVAAVDGEPEPEAPGATPADPEPAVERAADKIFFDFDSRLLTSAGKKALEGNALWLQAQPEIRIVLEGYTDERGSAQYNLALGEQRAEAARDYLLTLGIAPERISVVSYGEQKAAKGADEYAWARDRRVEFVAAK
jgi:peptidoglycan-associated lipoprotein